MIEIQLFICLYTEPRRLSLNIIFFFSIRQMYVTIYRLWQLIILLITSRGWIFTFSVYYDGETCYHELHGLSYQGLNQKQKCVKVKCGKGLMNLQQRILKAMGLDQSKHSISIVYWASQLVVGTHVFYNSL